MDDPEVEHFVCWENLLLASAYHAYKTVQRLRRLEAAGKPLTYHERSQLAQDEQFLQWVAPDLWQKVRDNLEHSVPHF